MSKFPDFRLIKQKQLPCWNSGHNNSSDTVRKCLGLSSTSVEKRYNGFLNSEADILKEIPLRKDMRSESILHLIIYSSTAQDRFQSLLKLEEVFSCF